MNDNSNIIPFAKFNIGKAEVKTKTIEINKPEKVVIRNPKIINKLPPTESGLAGLSAGHRAELHDLVYRWAELKTIQSNGGNFYGAGWKVAFKEATSAGEKGVSNLDEFPDCDFKKAKKELTRLINILKNTDAVIYEMNRLKRVCHEKLPDNLSEEKRITFQLNRFGKESMRNFELEQLQEYERYLDNNPSFNHKQDLWQLGINTLTDKERFEREDLLNEIPEWIAKLGISPKCEADYLYGKYEVKTIYHLSLEQLRQYCDYVSDPNPSFNPYESVKLQVTKKITVAILEKEFGTLTPTLEEVAERYLNVKKETARRKYNAGTLPFKAFKSTDSNKSPILVDLESLSAYLSTL